MRRLDVASDPLKIQLLHLLAVLAAPEENWPTLHSIGALPKVLQVLTSGAAKSSPPLTNAVLECLSAFAKDESTWEPIGSTALSTLLPMVWAGDVVLQRAVVHLMAECSQNNSVKELVRDSAGLPTLVQLMASPDEVVLEQAVVCVSFLSDAKQLRASLGGVGIVGASARVLERLSLGRPLIKERALWTLANMLPEPAWQDEFVRCDGLRLLAAQLTSDHTVIQSYALKIVVLLVRSGHHRPAMQAAGFSDLLRLVAATGTTDTLRLGAQACLKYL
eukprot:TRINITY_DN776_c2_g1_i1.p2 TRINITY_DN776_c2_g1~~TRINITY_DN776_c2_g1_i1.p2  ORF type:complete len:276 (+),score=122.19 TRINITY_DN776_c2_g1_i1:332-1159(+)